MDRLEGAVAGQLQCLVRQHAEIRVLRGFLELVVGKYPLGMRRRSVEQAIPGVQMELAR